MGYQVAVVGGGITGLCAAYRCRLAGIDVVVLESSNRLGGKIDGSAMNGTLIDSGPDGFLLRDPAMADLCHELGLGNDLVSPTSSGAFVWVDGALRPLPKKSVLGVPYDTDGLSSSGILSSEGLAELRRGLERDMPPLSGDASVGAIVRPRIGDEAFERLVDPLLGGINAGSADDMSLAACAAPLHEAASRGGSFSSALRSVTLTQRHAATPPSRPETPTPHHPATFLSQSVTSTQLHPATFLSPSVTSTQRHAATPNPRSDTSTQRHVAALAEINGEGGKAPVFGSVRGGMVRVVGALAAFLADVVHVGTPVLSLERERTEAGAWHCWKLITPRGPVRAEAVILAVPGWVAAELAEPHSTQAAEMLGGISYADVVLVTFVLPGERVAHSLNGNGFLVPRQEGFLTTACSWSSSKWKHYRMGGHVVLRVSAGRTDDRRWLHIDHTELVDTLGRELVNFGLCDSTSGAAVRVTPWQRSLPQYLPGHLKRMKSVESHLAADTHGLIATGAAFRGLGLPACVRQGRDAAQQAGRILTRTTRPSTQVAAARLATSQPPCG